MREGKVIMNDEVTAFESRSRSETAMGSDYEGKETLEEIAGVPTHLNLYISNDSTMYHLAMSKCLTTDIKGPYAQGIHNIVG